MDDLIRSLPPVPADAPLRPSGVVVRQRPGGELLLEWEGADGRLDDGTATVEAPLSRRVPNVVDWLPAWAAAQPDALFMAERDGAGRWQRWTWSQAWDQVQRIGSALLRLQSQRGNRPLVIAVLSGNSVPQALLTFAALFAGVVVAPVSPGYVSARDTERLRTVLGILQPHVVYAEDLEAARPALQASGWHTVDALEARDLQAWAHHPIDAQVLAQAHAAARGDAPAKVMFTSGSTGVPKGVAMSQAMLASAQATSAANLSRAPRQPQYLEWLPWHHVMGGNVNLHRLLRFGGSTWLDAGKPIPGRFDATLANLREVSPSFYFNVPLGYAMLLPALEADEDLARSFFRRLDYVSYGGAMLDPHLVARFDALALRHTGRRLAFTSAYGATETCGPGMTTGPGMPSAGALGLPSPGVAARLLPAGDRFELRLQGANIRADYLGQPDLAAAAHDEEGFYRTGDAVRWVDPVRPERGLVFAGRLSEDFKLASGTWVDVTSVRARLLAALGPLASDAAITGHDRTHIGALLFLDKKACRSWLGEGAEDLAADPRLLQELARRLQDCNGAAGGSSQRIERLLVLRGAPRADAFEITDKGYLNQRAVLQQRAGEVERLYAEDDPVLAPDPTPQDRRTA